MDSQENVLGLDLTLPAEETEQWFIHFTDPPEMLCV
jgi:hypothetical protein